MELKPEQSGYDDDIEPLPSNCTNMELKPPLLTQTLPQHPDF